MTKGVLPSQTLRRLVDAGFFSGVSHINPASIDLPIADEVYRVAYGSFPQEGETVRDLLKSLHAEAHDLRMPLEVGVQYMAKLGTYALPQHVYGYANPKSSTGRVNLLARLVADRVAAYDALDPPGWEGEAWVLLRARSFPILLSPGQAVSQLRLFDGTSFLDDTELEIAIKKYGLFFHPDGCVYSREQHQRQKRGSGLLISLDARGDLVGWECRGTKRPLDFSKKAYYHPSDFFTPVHARDGAIVLHERSFYILSTFQRIMVPPEYSAELRAVDVRLGDARVHAAGYLDPGWGFGKEGEAKGRPITLEVVPFEEDDRWVCGRNVARIRYERMQEPPVVPYDAADSHYTKQSAAMLSKHFVAE